MTVTAGNGMLAQAELPGHRGETAPHTLVLFGTVGALVAAFYAVVFSRADFAGSSWLAVQGVACLVAYVTAIAFARSRHTTLIAAATLVSAAVAMVPVTAAMSTQSDVHLLYLALGFAALAMIPGRLVAFRTAYGAGAIGFILVAEFAFAHSAQFDSLSPDVAQLLTTCNRVATVAICACAMLVILVRSARVERSLHGVAATEQIRANTDVLTGLANRRPMLSRFATIDSHRSSDFAIALVDLDDFKEINDAFGHDIGDKVIVDVADRLRAHFGPDVLVSRWGGDEFLVLVQGNLATSIGASLERLRTDAERNPVHADEETVHVTLSIGAAQALEGQSTEDVLLAADAALYSAKFAGRNRVATAPEAVGGSA